MHFQLLTVAAALTGLSAAAPGNNWSDYNSWGAWTQTSSSASATSSSSVKASSSTTYPVKPTTSSSSSSSVTKTSSTTYPVKPTTSSASVSYTTSYPGKPSSSTCGVPSTVTITTGSSCATGGASTVTVTSTATSCSSGSSGFPTPSSCYLTDDKANQIIATYDTLINRNIHGAEFNATANALLADSYSLTSNSINADEGLPLDTVTIPNKQVFISLFWNLPQGNGETTLDIFHSCNKISWRWTGTNPDGQLVRGISDFEITSSGQIGPVYSEYFNPTLDRCSNTTSTK